MDYLEYINQEENCYHPPRMRLERIDPLLQCDDNEFHERFRMSKTCMMILCEELSQALGPHRSGEYVLSPMMQILVSVRYYADGSFLRSTGDLFRISIASVSRIIHRVSHEISHLRKKYISFPSEQELKNSKLGFYEIAHFPGKFVFQFACYIIEHMTH